LFIYSINNIIDIFYLHNYIKAPITKCEKTSVRESSCTFTDIKTPGTSTYTTTHRLINNLEAFLSISFLSLKYTQVYYNKQFIAVLKCLIFNYLNVLRANSEKLSISDPAFSVYKNRTHINLKIKLKLKNHYNIVCHLKKNHCYLQSVLYKTRSV